jgi:hypothetical protein
VRHYRTCGLEGNQNGNRYQWNFTEGSRKPAYFDKRKTLKGEGTTTVNGTSFRRIAGGGCSSH